MKKNADYWIKQLDLTPHPEGGYYKTIRETNEHNVHHSVVYTSC